MADGGGKFIIEPSVELGIVGPCELKYPFRFQHIFIKIVGTFGDRHGRFHISTIELATRIFFLVRDRIVLLFLASARI